MQQMIMVKSGNYYAELLLKRKKIISSVGGLNNFYYNFLKSENFGRDYLDRYKCLS